MSAPILLTVDGLNRSVAIFLLEGGGLEIRVSDSHGEAIAHIDAHAARQLATRFIEREEQS